MNKIKELAEQAGVTLNEGFDGNKYFVYGITASPEELEKFAELIRADEREACARLLENGRFLHDEAPAAILAKEAAKAIRARGEKPLYTTPVHASDISQERVDETAKCGHEWGLVTDDALIEEVRRRGFTIRDAQISPKIKDEYELCCQKYDTCTEPCTPRGRHLAKREWVGLTDQEIYDIRADFTYDDEEFNEWGFAKDIEAKLKEKNE